MALNWEGKGENKQMSCFGNLLEVNGRAEIYSKDCRVNRGKDKPPPGSAVGTEATPAHRTGTRG